MGRKTTKKEFVRYLHRASILLFSTFREIAAGLIFVWVSSVLLVYLKFWTWQCNFSFFPLHKVELSAAFLLLLVDVLISHIECCKYHIQIYPILGRKTLRPTHVFPWEVMSVGRIVGEMRPWLQNVSLGAWLKCMLCCTSCCVIVGRSHTY